MYIVFGITVFDKKKKRKLPNIYNIVMISLKNNKQYALREWNKQQNMFYGWLDISPGIHSHWKVEWAILKTSLCFSAFFPLLEAHHFKLIFSSRDPTYIFRKTWHFQVQFSQILTEVKFQRPQFQAKNKQTNKQKRLWSWDCLAGWYSLENITLKKKSVTWELTWKCKFLFSKLLPTYWYLNSNVSFTMVFLNLYPWMRMRYWSVSFMKKSARTRGAAKGWCTSPLIKQKLGKIGKRREKVETRRRN